MPVVETPQSACRMGIARCDITPPVGIYHRMWGASTHDRSTGVHRPLTATALAVAPNGSTSSTQSGPQLVLIAIDHCLLWKREMDALITAASKASGISPDRLRFCFSHTHAAGLMGAERAELPGGEFVVPYLNSLAADCGRIVREAADHMQPVSITYGLGRCKLAAHRDFWDEPSQQPVCGFNPTGPADDIVLVARVSDTSGRIAAIVVNYACHPTTLAWQNTLISPDYPGAMREVIEKTTGATCVFLQGASGDIGPRDGYVGETEVADRNGRQLGYACLEALEALPPAGTRFEYTGPVVSGATLGTWRNVPIDAARRAAIAAWQLRSWHIPVPLRPDMPTKDKVKQQADQWRAREEDARSRGDATAQRDARAQVERTTRMLVNLNNLPDDGRLPLPVTLCKLGDAFWLTLDSEYYNWFQRELRQRHAGAPIIISTVTNGWSVGYLLPRESLGRGTYSESVSMVAPGTLERILEEVSSQITAWQHSD